MYANDPEMAKKWEGHTSKKKLPNRISKALADRRRKKSKQASANVGRLSVGLLPRIPKYKHAKAGLPGNPEESGKRTKTSTPKSMHDWFKAFPHQAAAVEKLIDNNGALVIAHRTGMGKTVTSIFGQEKLVEMGKAKSALVIVPSGLRENFAKDGLEKFLKNPNYQIVASSSERGREGYVRPDKIKEGVKYTIVSYGMFRRDPQGILKKSGADTIIADEYHKIRNEQSSIFKSLADTRGQVKNFMGLTASLVSNRPEEIASLMTVSEGKRMISPGQFKNYFTHVTGTEAGFKGSRKKVRSIRRHGELVKLTDSRIDYAESSQLKGDKKMPRKDTKFIDVPMSEDQWKLYQHSMKDLGRLKSYLMKRDPNVTVKEAENLFSQTAQSRRIANSVGEGRKMSLQRSSESTPKVNKLLSDVEQHLKDTPDGKVVVYSNLIRGGADVLHAGLKNRGIKHGMFLGKGTTVGDTTVTAASRDSDIEMFKKGKQKVLIVSGAGGEGLNLPNATGFFALDGHFNPEKIGQAEARIRRLGGQSHRDPEKRVVTVNRYRSVAPKSARPGFFARRSGKVTPMTTDEWMYATAGRKHKQNKELYDTIKSPHKYIRKSRLPDGTWKYEYPRRQKRGIASRLISGILPDRKNANRVSYGDQPRGDVRRV
jgi:SNF2 family DNA or RNA helicase